ncbi:MAG: hypothetical protein R6X05_14420, partial [Desulfobacterales bacterium]
VESQKDMQLVQKAESAVSSQTLIPTERIVTPEVTQESFLGGFDVFQGQILSQVKVSEGENTEHDKP